MDRRGKSGSRVCFTCNRANNAYGNMHKTIEDDGRHRCMLDCSSCRGELILSRVKGLPDYGPCHKAVDCPIHKEAQDRASHIAEISRIYRELTGERSEKKTFPPAAMTLYIDRCYEYMEGNHHASAEDVRRYAQKVLFEKAYPGIGIMDDVLQGEHNGYVQHVKELNQAKFFIELKPVMHFELSADAFELVRQDIYPYEVSEVRLYNVVTNRDEVVEFLEENKDCVEQYLYHFTDCGLPYSISNINKPFVYVNGANCLMFMNSKMKPSDLLEGLHESRMKSHDTLHIKFEFTDKRIVEDEVLRTWRSQFHGARFDRSSLATCISAPRRMANYEDSAPVHTLPVTHEINGLRHFICSLFDMTSKQTEAVQTLLSHRLSSVMGPPGTGKTFVMSVAIILQLLEDHGSALSLPASKIVVVAPSNVAVDAQLGSFHKNLVKLKEKLEAGRVNSLYRNVVQTVINEYLFHQSNCMAKEKGVAATTDNAKHKVPLVHRAYPINGKNLDQDLRFKYELNRVRRQHARVFFLTIDMAIRYNMTARFAEGSELGALSTDCMRTGVRHVFVDEASCIHVAKLFVLLSMFPLDHLSESSDIGSRLRLRLFGDEKQLTPYVPPHARVGYKDVQSVELTKKNVVLLGVNPMILSKLYYSHSRVQLNVCFRGPSGLYNFIFKEHYDGLVECVDKTNTRPRYVKVDHPSATKANSVYNEGHWDVIKSFVQSTIDETPEMEITILTPYVAQKNLIRRKLVAYLSQIDATENMVKNIKVRTIDEYQGREADCIILSLPNEKYGFLQDEFDELNNDYLSRRTIVALTRAKKQMIVIGNMAPVTELKTRCTLEEYLHKECEIREEAEDGQ